MRIRLGAYLAVSALALFGAATATAGLGGLGAAGDCPSACGDPQVNFSACNNATKASCKMVYDTVMEKRFHVCYQTVC